MVTTKDDKMKFEKAKEKICPFLGKNCVLEGCMFWNTTISGKKEIARYQIPYDTYPMDAGNKHRQLLKDGYIELDRSEGREMYAKYEESHEGYCDIKLQKAK